MRFRPMDGDRGCGRDAPRDVSCSRPVALRPDLLTPAPFHASRASEAQPHPCGWIGLFPIGGWVWVGVQRYPDSREWMVLLGGSGWSLEWAARVRSVTDPLSLPWTPCFVPGSLWATRDVLHLVGPPVSPVL